MSDRIAHAGLAKAVARSIIGVALLGLIGINQAYAGDKFWMVDDGPKRSFPPTASIQQIGSEFDPSSCESQARECTVSPNGRVSIGRGLSIYGSIEECRNTIFDYCKNHPYSAAPLNLKHGISQAQLKELILSCPGGPRGILPRAGVKPEPGSKRMQQCEAIPKIIVLCAFAAKDQRSRLACINAAYDGPR
jgi:hypothetical protein